MADFSEVVKQLKENKDSQDVGFADLKTALLGDTSDDNEKLENKTDKQVDVAKENTTLLGKTVNLLTGNKVSKSAAKEEKKDAAAADGKTNTILGKIAGGIGGLLQSGKDAAKKVGKTGLDILKGTALAALYLGIAMFLKSPYFQKAVDFLANDVMPKLKDFYENILKPIGAVLKDVFFKQWENIKVLFDDLGTAIEQFKSGDILGGITTLITGIGSFFLKTFDTAITGLYNIFAEMFGFEGTDSVWSSIKGFFNNFGTNIKKFFTDIYDSVLNFITSTYNNITGGISNFFTNLKDSVVNFFTDAYNTAKQTVSDIGESIKNYFTEIYTGIVSFFTDAYNNIIQFITNLNLFKYVKEVVTDLFEGIKGIFAGDFSSENFLKIFGSLFDIAFTSINLAINAIKDIFGFGKDDSDFGMNEPFRLSEFIGGVITDAIQVIKDWFSSLKIPSVGELITMAKDGFKGLVSSLFGGGNDDEDKLKKELDEIYAKQGDARNLKLTSKEKQALKLREQEIKKILAGEAPVSESNTVVTENKELQEDFNKPRPSKKTEVDFKGTKPSEMSSEQLNAAIIDYTKVRDSKNTVGQSIFDEQTKKYRDALVKRRKELMEKKTPKVERLDLSGIKKPEPTDAQFTTVREKPSAEIIENRRKSGLDVGGKFDYDVVKKVPVNKSDGAPIIVNAPTDARVNNNSSSTNVASNTFVDPDATFRRYTEFAL